MPPLIRRREPLEIEFLPLFRFVVNGLLCGRLLTDAIGQLGMVYPRANEEDLLVHWKGE